MAIGASAALLSAPACNAGATPEEGCHVLCTCATFLPGDRLRCEQECVMRVGSFDEPTQDCLQCAVDVEVCDQLARECQTACSNIPPSQP